MVEVREQSASTEGRTAGEHESAATIALRWLERDHQQRLVVDQDRRILWMNSAAESWLGRSRLQIVAGLLAAYDPGDQMLLSRYLAGCASRLTGLALPAADGDGHILLRGREIARAGRGCHIGLLLLRSGSGYRAEYANLDDAFKLTRKEHQVLLELVGGNSLDELSPRLGITAETARSHVRQIYAKLAVHSREKLFCRVVPYRL